MMKNKQFLTTSSLVNQRNGIYLGLSLFLLLGGCNTTAISRSIYGDANDSYSGGARRAPLLNQPSAVVSTRSPASEDSNTPFDRYDAQGNEIPTDKGKSESSTVGDISNFFADVVSGNSAGQSSQQPASSPPIRKPLAGNQYIPRDAAPPLQPQLPVTSPPVDMELEDEEKESMIPLSSAPESGESHPVYADGEAIPASSDEQSSGGGLLDRISSFFTSSNAGKVAQNEVQEEVQPQVVSAAQMEEIDEFEEFEKVEIEPQQKLPAPTGEMTVVEGQNPVPSDAVGETELGHVASRITIIDGNDGKEQPVYPQILSVPPTPPEFEAVKKNTEQDLSELQSDHNLAQQDKEALELEISGDTAVVSNKTDVDTVVHHSEPVQELSSSEKNEDDTTSTEAETEDSSFFGKIASFFSPDSDEDTIARSAADDIASDESPKNSGTAVPVTGQIIEDLDDDLEEEMRDENPVVTPQVVAPPNTSSTPSNSPVNTVVQVPETDNVDAAAPSQSGVMEDVDSNSSSLPSPDMIKTMRPSRYESLRSKTSSAY